MRESGGMGERYLSLQFAAVFTKNLFLATVCGDTLCKPAMAAEPLPQTPPPLRLDVQGGEHDDRLSVFSGVRPRLFGIAYRMLGSAAEAEDIVQDVWMRWQSTDRNAVQDAPAYLATNTTRLAINVVQ